MSTTLSITVFLSMLVSAADAGGHVRFATFNASLNRGAAGALIEDLSTPDDEQARAVAEIIQRVNPDVLLINEFDHDEKRRAAELFAENYLAVSQNGQPPVEYPFVFAGRSNTGIPSGFDLDNDGEAMLEPGAAEYGNDCYGFGLFPGQFGMLLLSKHPIVTKDVRTFRLFRWKDMPGALLPDDPEGRGGQDWYSAAELEVFRLSSKSHWDIPIDVDGTIIHALASHPTPPVFDGPDDRNGTRNHDEIRFWADYVDPAKGDYIYDDKLVAGGLTPGAHFVVMGDLNSDPFDGEGIKGAVKQVLESPFVSESIAPRSAGGPEQAERQGGANDKHVGDPALDTADFADNAVGNLRVDYVLPSVDLPIRAAGVFWPLMKHPLFRLVGLYPFPASDHRLVWVDLTPPGSTLPVAPAAAPRPRLILFVTIDQLRGDVLPQFADRFAAGGFRRLLERGVHYANAHYRHASTFTAAGHATLFTGGNPPEHGIVGNDWATADGTRVYALEDDRHALVGEPTGPHQGTSPRNLMTTTIGDELVKASGGRSRVFAVSVKDRGAILPAGHLGTAYWYSSASGRFLTSTYYADALPPWARAHNERAHAGRWNGAEWRLLQERSTYRRGGQDDRPFEISYGSLGRVFPHPVRATDTAPVSKTLRYTPFADELTLQFALALLQHEQLGRGDATDVLAISFSSTDYIGHAFGPNSLEAEDNLLRLDRTIAALLDAVDEAVGLEQTIVVLSSDHGVDASPEHRHQLACGEAIPVTSEAPRCGNTGRLRLDALMASANEALRAQLEVEADLVAAFWNPSFFLDVETIDALGLDRGAVERALADFMRDQAGVARALTRSELLAGRAGGGEVGARALRSFHPRRSGHVMVVQEPFWYLHPRPTGSSAMHGSPYAYDTHVPIIIVAPGVRPETVSRRVGPEDIAPTLALLLGIESPPDVSGAPLHDLFANRAAPSRP